MPPSLERVLERCSALLRMCGHGKDNNWSVRFADWFFVDCACCLFWRGVGVGISIMLALMLSAAAIVAGVQHMPVHQPAPVAAKPEPMPDKVTLAAATAHADQLERALAERLEQATARINTQAETATALLARIEALEKAAKAPVTSKRRKSLK